MSFIPPTHYNKPDQARLVALLEKTNDLDDQQALEEQLDSQFHKEIDKLYEDRYISIARQQTLIGLC